MRSMATFLGKLLFSAGFRAQVSRNTTLTSLLRRLRSSSVSHPDQLTSTRSRISRNSATGAEIKIPAAKTVKFTAGKAFKDAVNKRK